MTFMQQILFKIMNAQLGELVQMKAEIPSWPVELSLYHAAMVAYLKMDIVGLQAVVECSQRFLSSGQNSKGDFVDPDCEASFEIVRTLIECRLHIRRQEQVDESLLRLQSLHSQNSLWQGEIQFVCAIFHGLKHDYENERRLFLEAYRSFTAEGALAKALLAMQNSIAAEASLYPKRRFVVEYSSLKEHAIENSIFSTAGLCALNISREYQLLQAYDVALKLASEALRHLKRDLGTQHFGLALCHRAQLFVELGRIHEAKLDLQETLIFDFIEVRNARAMVQGLIDHGAVSAEGNIAPAWIDRCLQLPPNSKSSFGALEEKLLLLLGSKPMSRDELMEALFSDEIKHISYESVYGRFKNLLARVRKKAPELIQFHEGRYSLVQIHHGLV